MTTDLSTLPLSEINAQRSWHHREATKLEHEVHRRAGWKVPLSALCSQPKEPGSMRQKVKVVGIRCFTGVLNDQIVERRRVTLVPQYSAERAHVALWGPLKVLVDGPEHQQMFALDREFYIDITPVSEGSGS